MSRLHKAFYDWKQFWETTVTELQFFCDKTSPRLIGVCHKRTCSDTLFHYVRRLPQAVSTTLASNVAVGCGNISKLRLMWRSLNRSDAKQPDKQPLFCIPTWFLFKNNRWVLIQNFKICIRVLLLCSSLRTVNGYKLSPDVHSAVYMCILPCGMGLSCSVLLNIIAGKGCREWFYIRSPCPKDVYGSEVMGQLINLHRFEGENYLYPRESRLTPHKKTEEQKGETPQTREMHIAVLLMGEDWKTPLALIVLWVHCTCEVSLAGKLRKSYREKKIAAQCMVQKFRNYKGNVLYNARDLALRQSTELKSECNKSQGTYLLILSRSQLRRFSGLSIWIMSAPMVLFYNFSLCKLCSSSMLLHMEVQSPWCE